MRCAWLGFAVIVGGCSRQTSAPAPATGSALDRPLVTPRPPAVTGTLPIELGAPQALARARFGEPMYQDGEDGRFGAFDTFPNGLSLAYEHGLVIEVTAYHAGNAHYAGAVLGVALNDSIATAVRVWGSPSSRKRALSDDEVRWRVGPYQIDAEVWRDDADDPNLGHLVKDAFRQIAVRAPQPDPPPAGSADGDR